MASAKREPIIGIWGRAPSGVQGQIPWSGGQGAPPEDKTLLAFGRSIEAANLPTFLKSRNTENQTLSVFGVEGNG